MVEIPTFKRNRKGTCIDCGTVFPSNMLRQETYLNDSEETALPLRKNRYRWQWASVLCWFLTANLLGNCLPLHLTFSMQMLSIPGGLRIDLMLGGCFVLINCSMLIIPAHLSHTKKMWQSFFYFLYSSQKEQSYQKLHLMWHHLQIGAVWLGKRTETPAQWSSQWPKLRRSEPENK